MKVVYWKIECKDDSNVYSIRSKTKKRALEKFKESPIKDSYLEYGEDNLPYYKVQKIVIYYDDAYDLMDQLLTENCADYYSDKEYIIKWK
mgnify:CR=1 FL=1